MRSPGTATIGNLRNYIARAHAEKVNDDSDDVSNGGARGAAEATPEGLDRFASVLHQRPANTPIMPGEMCGPLQALREYILEFEQPRGYLVIAIGSDGSRSTVGRFTRRTYALKHIRHLRKAGGVRKVWRAGSGHVVSR